MKKVIFFIATIIAVSCNDKKEASTVTPVDSSAVAAPAPPARNEMKLLMDKMMMDMHMMKPTGNNEIDYAAMMTDHHKGAVEMAKLEVLKGRDSAMKEFANKIIAAQEKEISFMNEYIAAHDKKASPGQKAFQEALSGSMKAMMQDQPVLYNDTDKDFAAQMIPHHQSAVDMANAYLKSGNDPQLTAMSKSIVSSQSTEIEWLKMWLAGNK